MKSVTRFAGLFLVLVLLMAGCALAESATTAEEYEQIIAEKDSRIAELEAQIAELTAQLNATPEPSAEPAYPTLQNGSKGEAVRVLQARLKELNYLDGAADGSYGKGTAGAVSSFQAEAGLETTGIADEATQIALFADDAPVSKEYVTLDYKENSRDPDSYTGKMIKFSGRIIQVMEQDDYIIFRIATRKRVDDVVFAVYQKPTDYTRFLEDDQVNVWGTSTGIYTYETIMGGSVTIPSCTIDRIELK